MATNVARNVLHCQVFCSASYSQFADEAFQVPLGRQLVIESIPMGADLIFQSVFHIYFIHFCRGLIESIFCVPGHIESVHSKPKSPVGERSPHI